MHRFLSTLASILLLVGCIEPTAPDFQLEGPLYLVEGDITDQPGLSEVRVRRSDFRTVALKFDDISGATVTAEQRAGPQVEWTEVEGSPGVYRPPADFAAAAGQTWSLRVIFPDGTEAVSTPETVPPPSRVDAVRLQFDQEGRYDEARRRFVPIFRVLLDSADPAGEGNYYQWDYRYWEELLICLTCVESRYRNGVCVPDNVIQRNRETFDYLCDVADRCYRRTDGNRFLFASDRPFDGGELTDNPIGDIVFERFGGLLVEGIQYGITAGAYEYGRVISDLVIGSSGLNATIPTALTGNLRNLDEEGEEILGYVRAVSVARRQLYIERTTATGEPLGRDRPVNLEPIVGPFVPPRAPCAGNGRTPVRPEGWPR